MSTLKLVCLFACLFPLFNTITAEHNPHEEIFNEDACNSKPLIYCPPFVWLKPSESSHPNRTGMATASPGGPGCAQPVVTYSDELYIINACHKVYTRTWTATDPNNPTLKDTCIQTIKQVDEEAPVFDQVPSDIVIYTNNMDPQTLDNCTTQVSWEYPRIYDNHILQSVTETLTRNGVVVDLKRGYYFPAGITEVEYVAYDFCGNFSTYSFTINVMCADCHLSCPADVTVDMNDDITPTALGNASAYSGNTNCGNLTSTYYLDEVAELGCDRKQILRTWYGVFENMPAETYSCTQTISIQDMSALTLHNCPIDLNVVDNFTKAHWAEPIAVASNNANTITLTSNYSPGNTFPVGITTVIYTARDECGNEVSCSFKVSVLDDATYPGCPDDIQIKCNENGIGIVDYNPPSYTGSCNTCYNGGYKADFMYIGSFNGSNYYCSRSFTTYEEAQSLMAQHGGYLASINSRAENEFIANNIGTPTALIGLTDVNKEGEFVWDDGTAVTYSNWYQMQPNDYNNQDYVEIMKGTGLWNDVDNDSKLEFVMEIPCQFVNHLGGPKPGDHLQPGTYTVTYQIADGCGLDEYCTFDITVEEGLSIICQDDIFVEVATSVNEVSVSWDAPKAYSCCSSCTDPNNCVTVTQIAGPPSGSNFWRQSKTEIIYEARDACGNVLTCSFDILVDINTSTGKVIDDTAGSTMGFSSSPAETSEESSTKQTSTIAFGSEIEELMAVSEVYETKLYPNPVADFLQIELENYDKVLSLRLIDQQGRILVNKKQNILARNTIDMTALTKGFYFLQITYADQEPQTKRVVKI